jgi:hypothetical protein
MDTIGLKDTTFTVTGLSNLTKYYWRVNAVNAEGTGSWSMVWSFNTIGSPTQAAQIYPFANSTNIPVNVNFSWNKSQDQLEMNKLKGSLKNAKSITKIMSSGKKNVTAVSQYLFELTTDTATTYFVVNDSTLTDTTILVTGLKNLTSYWWRVCAMNETGWGAFTNWSMFTTIISPPGVASLLTPNNNTAIPDTAASILFTWDSAPLASSYELQMASDTKFNTVLEDSAWIPDTVFLYHPKNIISTFYWRVQGSNAGGTGSWSTPMTVSLITGINKIKSGIPVVYNLYQNYPNPFNPSTLIKFDLPFSSNVKIEVYNILGEKVRELMNEEKPAGYYEVNFNTTGLASGVYLYLLEAKSTDGKNEYRDVKKMMMIK